MATGTSITPETPLGAGQALQKRDKAAPSGQGAAGRAARSLSHQVTGYFSGLLAEGRTQQVSGHPVRPSRGMALPSLLPSHLPAMSPQCSPRGLPPRHALCQGEAQGSQHGDRQAKIKVHLFSFPTSGWSRCTKGSGPGGFSLQGERSPATGSQAPTLKAGEEGGHATGVPQLVARASRLPQGAPPAIS